MYLPPLTTGTEESAALAQRDHHAMTSGALASAALALSDSSDLESLSRPLLAILHELTDVDSVYLTEVRPHEGDQVIRFADNRGADEHAVFLAEDSSVEWEDSVCRRSLESGVRSSDDIERDLPGSSIARQLNIHSYAGVPVVTSDNRLLGTLCAAASDPVDISPTVVDVMGLLAKLIADRWERDRLSAEALRRAETAEEKLVERATFLAEAEHLLKSPLTVLRGWTEMLADDWDQMGTRERSDALGTMRRASQEATQQLEQLLEEARGEVLSYRLAPSPVRLDEVVAETVEHLRLAADDRHQVVGPLGPDAPTVIVDRYALWQVLWHLGENAVKYSPAGGRIEYAVETVGEQVALEIRDEGLGLPHDVDIFAPFVRGSHHGVHGPRGTGLGLHIVRTLVQAMGGSVTAERRPDRGSVFRVVLPRAGADQIHQFDQTLPSILR